MSVDSHVQNSKTIINNFRISKENGNVYSLNLSNFIINDKKGAKGLGIEYGYYNDDIEAFLSEKYERPIGLLRVKLEKWNNENITDVLSNDEIEAIKAFLVMLMGREPTLIDKTYNKTTIAKFLNLKPTPSDFVKLIDKSEMKTLFFSDHYPVVVFNKTKTNFISSISGFYVWKSIYNTLNWWFPITPKIAIHFVDSGVFSTLYKNSSCAEIIDKESVFEHNNKILEKEQGSKFKIVFSNDLEEVERLKEKYKK